MTPTLERIIAEVDALSPEEKRQLCEHLDTEQAPPARPRNSALLRELCGKYRDVLSPTEEFLARKREDTEWENRRFKDE